MVQTSSNGLIVACNFCIMVNQLCPARSPRTACGPVKFFVRPSLGFRCSKS